MSSFYITTPIYYVNDVPHLGHAYTSIIADVLARYQRLRGKNVHFLTGSDEHGQKIERAAEAKRQSPNALADRVVERFKATWQGLNISYDDFIRTTEDRHRRVVQEIWTILADRGDIYLGHYDGLYCVSCEEYYTESQAKNGTCPIHNTALEALTQPSYFFRMSRYQDALLDHFESHPRFVEPLSRRNEILSFIRSGLHDLSVSRTHLKWGIRVPGDPDHTIYVWIDALTNYISALGGVKADAYQTYWPANVHVIGKDILRFHAVYWPTLLLAAGLPLPQRILAHGWWTVDGQKMSKSLANAVDPNTLAEDIGVDALRYYLVGETPLKSDGDFSREGLIQRINADLANDLGNLLNRSLTMASKYCRGYIPQFAGEHEEDPLDVELIDLARDISLRAGHHFDEMAGDRAIAAIWELVRGTNKYIDTTAPYRLIRDSANHRRVEIVVANFLEALRWISLMIAPVMPGKAREIGAQLGIAEAIDTESIWWPAPGAWPDSWGGLCSGRQIQAGDRLFPRLDDAQRKVLIAKWGGTSASPVDRAAESNSALKNNEAGSKALRAAESNKVISIEEVQRLDLRVAEILSAERIKGADRLLQLKLGIGNDTRQVVAGIAETYTPEELPGKKVVFVANLKPAKIRGIVSQGMILAAGENTVEALTTLDRDVPAGLLIR